MTASEHDVNATPKRRSSILLSIGLLILSVVAAGMVMDGSMYGFLLAGAVLGIAASMIVSLISGVPKQGGGRTVFAVLLPLAACFIIAGSILLSIVFSGGLFGPAPPPTLAGQMQDEADDVAQYFSPFLATGTSDVVKTATWTSPKGEHVYIAVTLKKNKDGVLVEAKPQGAPDRIRWVTKTYGAPASESRQILENGMLVYSLDYFKQQASTWQQASFLDMLSPEYEVMSKVSMGSGGRILDWMRSHDSRLPSADEAADLLSKAKKTFAVDSTPSDDDGNKAGDDGNKANDALDFRVTSYTYHATAGDRFTIETAWTCSMPEYIRKDGVSSVSGTWAVEYGLPDVMAFRPMETPLMVVLAKLNNMQLHSSLDVPASISDPELNEPSHPSEHESPKSP